VAVPETVTQVEATELVGTAPGQGVTMVEAATLEGAAGQAVREVEAASVEAAGQAAVGEAAAALVEAAVQGVAAALTEAVTVMETAA
jgi:hypothetical protein